MSWLSDWFRKSKIGAIEKASQGILGLLGPILAPALKVGTDTLWEIAKDEVNKSEAQGGTGDYKFDNAFRGIVQRFGEVSKVFFSIAIELAVGLLKAKLKI